MPEQTSSLSSISSLNDRALLRRFVQDADEAAFAEIVRRHQGLVLSVCRRVIGEHPDVDDAFQATFITLARRPRQIRRTSSISSWLYTVAWRTSWRLVKRRRKNTVEPLLNDPIDVPDDPLDRIATAQDCVVLDEELNRLPQHYREVLLMTYFASQTSQQIADELKVSKGAVDGRLRQARNMLRTRLARRGVAIGAIAVAGGLCQGSSAVASPVLLDATIQLGTQTLNGSGPGATDLSHLEPLIQAETAMITSKTLITAMFCVTVIGGMAGMNGLSQGVDQQSELPTQIEGVVMDAQDDDSVDVDANTQPSSNAASAVEVNVDEKKIEEFDDSDGSTAKLRQEVESVHKQMESLKSQVAKEIRKANSLEALALEKMKLADAALEIRDRQSSEITRLKKLLRLNEIDPSNILPKAAFRPWPNDAQPVERWTHMVLQAPAPKLDFPGSTPLPEVLEQVTVYVNKTHGNALEGEFRLTVLLDFAELDLEGITTLEDVAVRDIYLEGITLRNALDLIFAQTADPQLTYIIRNEVMLVTTKAKAESDSSLTSRVYNVRELSTLPMPARAVNDFRPSADQGGGGLKAERTIKPTLADLVMQMTGPPLRWFEIDGEGGAIQMIGDSLVVRQTPHGHQEIVRLLNQLTESTQKPLMD